MPNKLQYRQLIAESLWWCKEGIGHALQYKDNLNTLIVKFDSLILEVIYALYETIPEMIDVFLVDVIANVYLPKYHPTTHARNLRFLRKRISHALKSRLVGKKRPHSSI